ncbi:MAG: RNA pseudouridine synthase [Spartobacteria bacterium]|nr:RNA pseudouridine synthase [Spartobacteria bacterium]
MHLDVLYADNHLLAVNKPPLLLTQPSGTDRDNLEDRAKAWVKAQKNKPGAVYLHAVHRLDREVSGVVLFARTSKALTRMTGAVRERRVTKIYHAVVDATDCPPSGLLTHWLKHGRHRAEIASKGTDGAKEARLRFTRIGGGPGALVLEIELLTGRYHQIRAQLAAEGMPIHGDTKYGSAHQLPSGAMALHHARLTVEHPVTREPMVISAPHPASWKGGLQ